MADFIQGLDPQRLVFLETILSFAVSPFSAPPYNLPLFLFGVYSSQDSSESIQSLKLFTGLVGASAFFDFIWIIANSQSIFVKAVSIIIMLLKGPTFFAFLAALRQRGEHFGFRGNDLSGPTIWSMPGGFSSLPGVGSRAEYQDVDAARAASPQARPPPAAPQQPAVHSPSPATNAPGSYQTV